MSSSFSTKNMIIKKKSREKEQELLDEFLTQLQAEKTKEIKESVPIEITDQVKGKMEGLMDDIRGHKDKIAKLNLIKKQIGSQLTTSTRELVTLMKLYGLGELIKDDKKFLLDQTTKKKPLKKSEFNQVISSVVGDQKMQEIYTMASEVSEEVVVDKLKFLKYKGE